MKRMLYACLATGMFAAATAGCTTRAPADEPAAPAVITTFTGIVEFNDAEVSADGGEEPLGYILSGSHRFGQLYLRYRDAPMSPYIRIHAGKPVVVRGVLGVLTVGGVNSPRYVYPVLDVIEISPVD